ncbi:hypothetical protein K2173_021203 [Erythroxylum novogranatense]|uniref:Oberon coiled-coil region domain-containing protein n=1 Tax=Erythroxylum novogranatense TaxID=1862640 RepID=A0AAV8TPX9_9ROSI|nr:hypothetical protein K2173_021203 [Erythroxylum novogranatense]
MLRKLNAKDNLPHISTHIMAFLTAEEPVLDELESVVRMKQVDGKMFQAHANEARREPEGLKRIAITKNEKIEEEIQVESQSCDRGNTQKEILRTSGSGKSSSRVLEDEDGLKADVNDLLLKMKTTKQNMKEWVAPPISKLLATSPDK